MLLCKWWVLFYLKWAGLSLLLSFVVFLPLAVSISLFVSLYLSLSVSLFSVLSVSLFCLILVSLIFLLFSLSLLVSILISFSPLPRLTSLLTCASPQWVRGLTSSMCVALF